MSTNVHLDLVPLKPEDIPDPSSPNFSVFLDSYFSAGEQLAESMDQWLKHSTKVDGTVQIVNLTSASSQSSIQKQLSVKEHWCGRISQHSPESVDALISPDTSNTSTNSVNPIKNLTRRLSGRLPHQETTHSHGAEPSEVERQAAVMNTRPTGLYERFRRGLLEYHSENEREYIESCRETECLQVFQPHVAEVWRLTYVTSPPANPRTFVVLLLSRELKSSPASERCFMNISLPFSHPDCLEKQRTEKSRVRGKYVSVERVKEIDGGKRIEWRMGTSSDAGGNIPRFLTNQSLPSKIAEDVPSFLTWMVNRFPQQNEGDADTVVR